MGALTKEQRQRIERTRQLALERRRWASSKRSLHRLNPARFNINIFTTSNNTGRPPEKEQSNVEIGCSDYGRGAMQVQASPSSNEQRARVERSRTNSPKKRGEIARACEREQPRHGGANDDLDKPIREHSENPDLFRNTHKGRKRRTREEENVKKALEKLKEGGQKKEMPEMAPIQITNKQRMRMERNRQRALQLKAQKLHLAAAGLLEVSSEKTTFAEEHKQGDDDVEGNVGDHAIFLLLDVETTGLDPKSSHIIQLAAKVFQSDDEEDLFAGMNCVSSLALSIFYYNI